MTEPERRVARQIISEAKRRVLVAQGVLQPRVEIQPALPERPCDYCGRSFHVTRGANGRKQRFCCPTHHSNYHRRERMRRERTRLAETVAA